MNEITQTLLSAIKSTEMAATLDKLNRFFYNRKHENQIRDKLSLIINEEQKYQALTEFPKNKRGAVDLSIFFNGSTIATVEMKHFYPKDLFIKADIASIISDLTRKVEFNTSHFILIIQQRYQKSEPSIGCVKYLERELDSKGDISDCTKALEENVNFPKNVSSKESCMIDVSSDDIDSKYHFIIFALDEQGK